MTMMAMDKRKTETGILRCQEETAVSSYKILILEQQERIAVLETDLAAADERFDRMTDIALDALANFTRISEDLSRLRAEKDCEIARLKTQNERLDAALQTAWAALGRAAE